jgi:cobalt/nickel transport protein
MMKMKKIMLLSLVFIFTAAMTCSAHFIMMYTPETLLDNGGNITVKNIFGHPFEASVTMNLEKPNAFFVVHKEKRTDLLNTLKPISWQSLENSEQGWENTYQIRSMGDYVFCLDPVPYFDTDENKYIQQITKMIVNNGGLPTDWDAQLGLKTEIVPLDKPYALYTGNVFRGVVLSEGQPVPYAEIEVEYLNHTPDMKQNKFAKKAAVTASHDTFITMTIKTNANGEFAFGIPKAGWWGFASIGSGPDKILNGEELEQDAVIWIQARDI